MGYYINTDEVQVTIKADQLDAALAEMKRINGPEFDHLKNGGSYGPGGKTSSWYSWMPESFEDYTNLLDFLTDACFEGSVIDDNGDLVLGFYDNKHGNQDVFLEYLAPFIDAGSYVVWTGEDHEMWRNEFDGEKMLTLEPVITWK